MRSSKAIFGIFFFIMFVMGSGFILAEFGDKSNDNPPADQSAPAVADIPINPAPEIPAPEIATPVTPVRLPALPKSAAPVTKETAGITPAPPAANQPTPVSIPPLHSSPYADGTYSATGSYNSPAGMESIVVSITLKNGIVESSSVTNRADNKTSSRYQDMFISGYKAYVTGKSIASISIGRVSGSSLTGSGFNSALAKIKVQATA